MRSIVLIMLLASGIAAAATVYKWVDAEGVTHYSDQPHPGATTIELQAAQTYTAPPAPAVASSRQPAPGASYSECAVYRPTADEALINVSAVTVKLRLNPDLRPGDKAFVALDGKVLRDLPAGSTEFTVSQVDRGTHTVAALVEDLGGNVLCQSPPVTFHVRQASKLAPQSPTAPKSPVKPPRKP